MARFATLLGPPVWPIMGPWPGRPILVLLDPRISVVGAEFTGMGFREVSVVDIKGGPEQPDGLLPRDEQAARGSRHCLSKGRYDAISRGRRQSCPVPGPRRLR